MSENTQATESVQSTAAPELTVIDLQNIRSVIDVAARRGAFGAAEMAAVGGVYDKLNAFLNAVAPAETQESADQTAAE
jgi:hypothetical protein